LNTFGSDDVVINKGAGDYSAYDGSQIPIIQYELLDVINEWYTDEYSKIRSMLYESIVHSVHIYRGVIYRWNGSLPSGNPLTALLNTMYNSVVFRYAWYLQDITRPSFHTCVKLIILGDDNGFAVHPDYMEFNELRLPELLITIGLTYTPEDKKSLLVHPARKLKEIEFLKRKFRYDDTYRQYLAPLRYNVLEEMVQFTKKGSNSGRICIDNCIIAIREASLHDKYVYDEFCKKVIDEAIKYYPDLTPSEPWYMSYRKRKDGTLGTHAFF